ncbi:MAG: hypothetical protein LASZOEIN_001772 [Candidatus Fervidibacter sp.]
MSPLFLTLRPTKPFLSLPQTCQLKKPVVLVAVTAKPLTLKFCCLPCALPVARQWSGLMLPTRLTVRPMTR